MRYLFFYVFSPPTNFYCAVLKSFSVKDQCACVKTSNSFVVLLIFWIWLSQVVCLVGRICGIRAYFQPNSVTSAKIRLIRISAENMVQPAEFFEKSGWGVYPYGMNDTRTGGINSVGLQRGPLLEYRFNKRSETLGQWATSLFGLVFRSVFSLSQNSG